MELTKTLQETLDAVELGEATAKELADKLGVSVSGVRKRLAKLIEAGLVEKIQEGRTVKFKAVNVDENTVDEGENKETDVKENESNEVENATSNEDDDGLVDIYINGKYTISVEEDRVNEVVKRCNPNAEFEKSVGNKYFYVVRSGDKG